MGQVTMNRAISIIGLVVSLGVLFAAYTVTPEGSDGTLHVDASLGNGCVSREFALDEGYGVSRIETRLVCSDK
jgi:hypothetical protein